MSKSRREISNQCFSRFLLRILDNIINKICHFLQVSCSNQCIGSVAFEHHFQNKSINKLHKFYFLQGLQGKGIGKLLIEQDVSKAVENDMLVSLI